MTSVHALLLTDVVDSTRAVERLGDARAAETWYEHDRCARDLLLRHAGREIDRTDGFFLLFDSAGDASRYALSYHDAMARLGFRARCGLHVGAVILRHNDPQDVARGAKPIEVEGLAKPIAARVMALAGPGQTLLTSAARAALDALPEGTCVQSHGHYQLKGVESPIELFEFCVASRAGDPPGDTDKGYRVLQRGDVWVPVREVRHNLPSERDEFVGRANDLRRLGDRLDAGRRLLTIVGPGGVGKTRLAGRHAWTHLGRWPGGVYFCDLSEARTRDGILGATASALGVALGAADATVQLGHAIASRGRCLLVFDNFEQVVHHAKDTLGAWLDRAPEAAFLATSREPLHLAGEEVFPLEPLPPATDAADLFVLRARAHHAAFDARGATRDTVERIVALLDGMPLAIELAAARVRVLPPHRLLERLNERFRVLAAPRGVTGRQATLRAAIDWSWQLLAPWEQAALMQCAVFDGGFGLETAEAVLDLSAFPEAPPILDVLQALVDKSLVRVQAAADSPAAVAGDLRFGLYISIQDYAMERLAAAGPLAQATERRHGAYFAALGSDEAVDALNRHGGIERRRTLGRDLANLVAACRRAVRRADAEVAVPVFRATWEVLQLRGPFSLAAALAGDVLAIEPMPDVLRAAALSTAGNATQRAGRVAEASELLHRSLALCRAVGDRRREGVVLGDLGLIERLQGRMDEARDHLENAVSIHHAAGRRHLEGRAYVRLGSLHNEQGRIDEALAHFQRGLAIVRDSGSTLDESSVLNLIGVVNAERGRLDEARARFEESIATARRNGDRVAEAEVLTNLGCLHQDQGTLPQARECFERSLAVHRDAGNRRWEGYVLGDLGRLLVQVGDFEEARACLEQSLGIMREMGDRRIEGSELRSLGDLYMQTGRLDEARTAFGTAETLLRQIGDKHYLAHVLCGRAETERKAGTPGLARSYLAEAEQLAAAIHAGPGSELGRKLDALRSALR